MQIENSDHSLTTSHVENEASWDARFLREYFSDLPDLVLWQIFSHLEPSQIHEALVHVSPNLRNTVFNLYYRKEIHFVLEPIFTSHSCALTDPRRFYADIFLCSGVKNFFRLFTDASPTRVEIFGSVDFGKLQATLTKHRESLERVPYLTIDMTEIDIVPENISFLFSFPNLFRLRLQRCTLSIKCQQMLEREIPDHELLKEVTVCSCFWPSIGGHFSRKLYTKSSSFLHL